MLITAEVDVSTHAAATLSEGTFDKPFVEDDEPETGVEPEPVNGIATKPVVVEAAPTLVETSLEPVKASEEGQPEIDEPVQVDELQKAVDLAEPVTCKCQRTSLRYFAHVPVSAEIDVSTHEPPAALSKETVDEPLIEDAELETGAAEPELVDIIETGLVVEDAPVLVEAKTSPILVEVPEDVANQSKTDKPTKVDEPQKAIDPAEPETRKCLRTSMRYFAHAPISAEVDVPTHEPIAVLSEETAPAEP